MNKIPEIEYSSHSYYKFDDVSLATRCRALIKFLSAIPSVLYNYLKSCTIFPLYYFSVFDLTERNQKLSADIEDYLKNGVAAVNGSEDHVDRIITQLEAGLGNRLEDIETGSNPRFNIRISRRESPVLFNLLLDTLRQNGVLDMGRAQLGRKKIRLEEIYLFVQDTSVGWRDEERDYQYAKTRYYHIDSTPPNKVCKFILYLNDVDLLNGPFQYIHGSHTWEKGFKALIRRCMHRSRLQTLDFETRRLFSALPKFLQQKAEFGNDILPGLWEPEPETYLGKRGKIVVFDNSGIHRGALIESGRRITIHGGIR